MFDRRLLSLSASFLLLAFVFLPLRNAMVRMPALARPANVPSAPTAAAVEVGGCRTAISHTLSASEIRACETLTVTTRVTTACRACSGGINVMFIIPSYVYGVPQRVGAGVIDVLERLQKASETEVAAGVVYYDPYRARVLVPLTEKLSIARAIFSSPPPWVGYGGYEMGASAGLRLLRAAADSKGPRCDIVVFMGAIKEHEGVRWELYRQELLRAAQMMRNDESTLMVYCTGAGDISCLTMRQVPKSPRYYSEIPDVQKIPGAVRTRIDELLAASPAGLRSLGLDQDLPTGLAYVKDSATPPLSEVVSDTMTTTLRWLWNGPMPKADYTTTYGITPAVPAGLYRIGGLVDVAPLSGLRHQLPVTPISVSVTGPCAPTPTAPPPPTPTATARPTPTASATAIRMTPATPTRTPVPTATPTRVPLLVFLPLLLREDCQPGNQRLDVALVIDASTSMLERTSAGRSKLEAARDAAGRFLGQLHLAAGDQAAIVAFNSDAALLQPLTGDRAALDAALARIQPAVQTCLVCGVDAGADELASPRRRAGSRPVLILLTDGRSNPRPASEAVDRAAEAKRAGVLIYAVGLGEELDLAAMAAIASTPGAFYRAADAEDLAAIYEAIAVEIPCPAADYWGQGP